MEEKLAFFSNMINRIYSSKSTEGSIPIPNGDH
jgi:hypothetical protein